jgi:hypothetical protein
MRRPKRTRLLATIVLSLIAVAGCHEYEAVVEVRPDGSGTRSVTLRPELDAELSEMAMHQVFRVSPDEGWRREEDEDGDAFFRRVREATGPDGWAALGEDIRIYSRADGGAGDRRKGPSGLTNDVSLETGRTDEGRTYTYRERLRWEGLKEDLTAVMSAVYETRARAIRPALSDVCVAELRGLFRAHLAQTWDRVRLTEDEDLFIETLQAALRPDVEDLVARRRASVAPDSLVALAAAVLEDEDNQVESIVERDLMGVAHATFATLRLELRMPGEIIDTNGEREGGGVVTWNVGLLDPIDKKVELVARSLVRD